METLQDLGPYLLALLVTLLGGAFFLGKRSGQAPPPPPKPPEATPLPSPVAIEREIAIEDKARKALEEIHVREDAEREAAKERVEAEQKSLTTPEQVAEYLKDVGRR